MKDRTNLRSIFLVTLAPLLTVLLSTLFTVLSLLAIGILCPTIISLTTTQQWVQVISKSAIILVLYFYCNRIYKIRWQNNKFDILFLFVTVVISVLWWLIELYLRHNVTIVSCTADLSQHTILFFLKVVLLAPILEELLFRKWMFDYMKIQKFSPFIILAFTSILFYLWHGEFQRWDLLLSGFIFGGLYLKSENIYYPIICHMILNLMSFLFQVN